MAKKYNCIKNGIQYFRKTKVIGYKTDGSPIRKEFYGDGEKDADRQIEEYMNRIKSGLQVGIEQITIEQVMYSWLWDVLFPSVKTKSASFEKHETNYRLYIKNSDIGHLPLYNIYTKSIQLYYNKLFFEKRVSSKKIFDINKTLRKFFNYCVAEHYIKENPCSLNKIEIVGNADGTEEDEDEDEIIVFNDKELNILKQNIKYIENSNNTLKTSIQLDLVTGLRKGELLGLKRKNVDLDNCVIKVRKTLKLVKVFEDSETYKRELKLILPKTQTSIRNVNFPKNFVPILEKYFKEQELKYKKNNKIFDSESLIFTTESCNPINPANYYRAWKRLLKRLDIPERKFHAVRDTYATSLIRRGAKIIEIKELLGHSTIKTTEKYYIFVFPDDKINTINLISDFIL